MDEESQDIREKQVKIQDIVSCNYCKNLFVSNCTMIVSKKEQICKKYTLTFGAETFIISAIGWSYLLLSFASKENDEQATIIIFLSIKGEVKDEEIC